MLLRYGADVSVKADRGHTALHKSVCGRHLAVSKAPIKAGADLGAKACFFLARPRTIQGHTPLHLAAGEGSCEGMVALIDVGANVNNSRLNTGATPLHLSASCGKLEAVNIRLWAKANPLPPVGISLPFDVAAQEGHLGVMHELVQRFGLDGCAREGSIEALEVAAFKNHEDVVAFLCDSGVVDTEGTALCAAVEGRAEACVKPLLVRRGGHVDIDVRAYINISQGRDSPLLCTIDLGRFHAPRFARLLLDNGADTTSKVLFELDVWGLTRDTPMVAQP